MRTEQQMMTLEMRAETRSLAPSLAYEITYMGDILIEEACAGSGSRSLVVDSGAASGDWSCLLAVCFSHR